MQKDRKLQPDTTKVYRSREENDKAPNVESKTYNTKTERPTKQLYSSTIPDLRTRNVGSEDIPWITKLEIKTAWKQLKNKKIPGENKITSGVFLKG